MIGELIELSNGIETGISASISKMPSIGTKKNISKYKATIVSHNEEYCNIEGSIQKTNYETNVNFKNESYCIKSFGQNNTFNQIDAAVDIISGIMKHENIATKVLPSIYDSNNKLIGHCEYLYGGSGINVFPYVKYTINDINLYAYELSHDTKDILYCIYNESQQMVATISKKTLIKHGHARYTIYSCNDEWFKYVTLIAICWSIQKTSEDGGVASITKKREITLVPELLAKYNPTFIDQVKQKEGISNQPENMSLVKEKIKESKKSSDVKLSRILTIIMFILAFIIIFSMYK